MDLSHPADRTRVPSPTAPPAAAEATLAEVGEFGTIARLVARFGTGPQVLLGPGDDAAVVAVGGAGGSGGGRVVLTTDVLVEGRHFRRDWAEASDIGARAAAQSLSDVNAMGGRATALTVGLAVPPGTALAWVLGLADGLAAESALVGAVVVGGDLTRADTVVVSVTAMGGVDGEPVTRGGARPGDLVAVNGRLGWAAAGLAVLGRGFRSPRAVVDAYRRPVVPYAAGPQAVQLGATSLVDVSDGLVADLGHVCASSGVDALLESAALVVDEPLQAVGSALGTDPTDFVLTGGDDHALVATFAPGTALPAGWTVLGQVVAAAEERGRVLVDGQAPAGEGGFRHF
ncbi:thiamine-phosphate kinase [Nocardioides sp. HDW12B]|uniref:thiamine-phosphate kinase n=1 Tax=Nocardioides sp. HDW12B TaxID=2714939 RepID=UPI001409FEAD|nr:thiamine-phosphate kinase [Nocardioides sp. HDW12B]QIK67004.1 thiamine-phosphate kinase [Nocardioides sp. HDW12B]